MAVQCKLKIPSLGITVRHHLASLVKPNSYHRDGIFNLHLSTIRDSYSPKLCGNEPCYKEVGFTSHKNHLLDSDILEMSRDTTKPTNWHVRPAKNQVSLGIRPV